MVTRRVVMVLWMMEEGNTGPRMLDYWRRTAPPDISEPSSS